MTMFDVNELIETVKRVSPGISSRVDHEISITLAGGHPGDDALRGQLSYIVGLPIVDRFVELARRRGVEEPMKDAEPRRKEAAELAMILERMLESSDPTMMYVVDTTVADALILDHRHVVDEFEPLWGPKTRRVLRLS
jgi:hypothetical protein